jgi:hypothetical protein
MNNMFDETKGDNLETFLERLPETVAWCSRVTEMDDLATAFRSDRLKPGLWADGRKDMVEGVARGRSINGAGQYIKTDIAMLANGRLLVYQPDFSLWENVSSAETKGFFDEYDAPPWDTWISYFYESKPEQTWEAYLVCWIPATFIDIVSKGIAVNSSECIGWLDKRSDLAIYEMLKERNLL